MRIGVLGTGVVGQTLSTALRERGHDVVVGSRTAPPATFAEAAAHGELLLNCTAGMHSLEALTSAGAAALAGKVLIDVANPLDFSAGFPPRLSVGDGDSLGEQIQAAFPRVKVVKALNTMNCQVMVDPSRVPGEHVVLIAGEDAEAKREVTELIGSFGWPEDRVRDLGGIAAARGSEMFVPLWLTLFGQLGTGNFNVVFEIAR